MYNKVFCTVLFSFFSWLVSAQDIDTVIVKTDVLDEVVITATRTSVNRSNVPLTVSVVNRAEIEATSESALLPALSEHIPGMFVNQRGVTGFGVASGGTGAITLRGVGGGPTTQLLILIDGHPQYMGVMGHHLPDAYVASDVNKVEVIRGPASILYGSNAMGGVINIITRKQEHEGWSAGGRVMYGSHNTQKYMANAGLKKGKFDGYMSINHDRTDGHRDNSNFSITNGYAKISYQANERFRLWGNASLASYNAQNPGSFLAPRLDNVQEILRGVVSVTAENDFENMNGALKFFYNFGDHKIDDGYLAEGVPTAFHFRSNDHNYGVAFYQAFRFFQGNSVTVGIDYKNFGGDARDEFKDKATPARHWVDTTAYEIAGYLIMQQTIYSKLTLNAGLRLENSSIFGFEPAPQFGLAYRPLQNTVLKASIAKGFRSPTIRELYYRAPWAAANPDLKPEQMWNYEFSIGQAFWDGRLSAEFTGYIAKGSNLIVAVNEADLPPPGLKNDNVGEFSNKGFELELRWNVMKNLDIKGNYSYLNMEKTVINAPKQQAYIATNYRLNKWTLSANYQYIHDLYLTLGDVTTQPIIEKYGLLNARISYRPLKWLDVFMKGENLTGKQYQTLNGYPMPGITIFGGVNFRLGS